VFKIEGLKNTKNFEMQILNRWGETLFVSHDPNLGWDGYYKGELVQDGVYMYQINFTYYDRKTYQFSGTLTLLK
jgi:gliding motility-associated-like protein